MLIWFNSCQKSIPRIDLSNGIWHLGLILGLWWVTMTILMMYAPVLFGNPLNCLSDWSMNTELYDASIESADSQSWQTLHTDCCGRIERSEFLGKSNRFVKWIDLSHKSECTTLSVLLFSDVVIKSYYHQIPAGCDSWSMLLSQPLFDNICNESVVDF